MELSNASIAEPAQTPRGDRSEYQKRYRREHAEQLAKYFSEYQQKHHHRISERQRRYRRDHQQDLSEKKKQVYQRTRAFATDEELQQIRRDPRLAKAMFGPQVIVCIACGMKLKTLSRHLGPAHQQTADQYRDRWGLNRNTALTAVSVSVDSSKLRKRRRMMPPVSTRFVAQLTRSDNQKPARLEGRLNHRTPTGARPYRWKESAAGKPIEDWTIAKLHLAGRPLSAVATAVGLSETATYFRLHRMGFTSTRAVLYHMGEPVSAQLAIDTCRDFGITMKALAELVGVSYSWATHRFVASNAAPLSPKIATALLSARKKLRETVTRPAASSVGGRPTALLDSDRRRHLLRYSELLAESQALRTWAIDHPRGSLEQMWTWLCERGRTARCGSLLRWPTFFEWLRRNAGVDLLQELRASRPSDLALEFLGEGTGASVRTLKRAASTTMAEIDPLLTEMLTAIDSRGALPSAETLQLPSAAQLSVRRLAAHMAKMGIKPVNVRVGSAVVKGYRRADLEKAIRYTHR